MSRINKITIIGTSVALRVRPPLEKDNYNYGVLLEKRLNKISNEPWQVINMGFGRATTNEILLKIDNYISTFPEVFIVNVGAVDAPSREVPLWYSDIIYGRRRSLFSGLLLRVYYRIIIRSRRFFTLIRLKKSWVSKKKYKQNTRAIISKILKDTNAKVLILGINKGNERLENILPGTLQNYLEYSNILKEIAKELSLEFLSVEDLSDKEYFPDGVHYNKKGHVEIANRILNVLELKLDSLGKKA